MLTEREGKPAWCFLLHVTTLNHFCLCLPNRDHVKRHWSMPSTNREDVNCTHFWSSVSIYKIECLLNRFQRAHKGLLLPRPLSYGSGLQRRLWASRESGRGSTGGHTRGHTLQRTGPAPRPGPTLAVSQTRLLGYVGCSHCWSRWWVGAEGPVLGSVSKDAILFTVTDSGPITVPGTK